MGTVSGGARELFEIVRSGGGGTVPGPTLEAVGSDDPDVVQRWRSVDRNAPQQVVTAYRPRVEAPRSYPPELPFVPGVRVFVTEMDDSPGEAWARWLVEDDTDVLAEVLSELLRHGWTREPDRELGFPFPGHRIVVGRSGEVRLLLETRLDESRRVVQLLSLV